jgi:hypothetical protein
MADDRAPDQAPEAGVEEMGEADSGSSSSSSSDSEFEELTVGPEDARLLMKLEQQLQDNPSLYDSHVQVRQPLPAATSACRRCCARSVGCC